MDEIQVTEKEKMEQEASDALLKPFRDLSFSDLRKLKVKTKKDMEASSDSILLMDHVISEKLNADPTLMEGI